jgi:fumarate hydratase class II
MVAHSLMAVTSLVPHIGYDRASRIAHHAHAHGLALRQAAFDAEGISAAEYDAWVLDIDPASGAPPNQWPSVRR